MKSSALPSRDDNSLTRPLRYRLMAANVHGPFDTPAAAMAAIEPLRRALAAQDPAGVAGIDVRQRQTELRRLYITQALEELSIEPGSFGTAVAQWLAGQSLERLAVILDWLARAYEAGNIDLLVEAAEYIDPCPARPDGRCVHGEWAACRRTDLAWRLRGLDPAGARRNALVALAKDRGGSSPKV